MGNETGQPRHHKMFEAVKDALFNGSGESVADGIGVAPERSGGSLREGNKIVINGNGNVIEQNIFYIVTAPSI